jgi:RNA 2',3'-cyclic 3'-phosphodiesterase
MARPVANLRLFVAIYPPPEVADAMLHALSALVLPPRRATPREQVHLTLQFIGDTPAKDLDATIESVQRAAAGLAAFVLSPCRLIRLPERGRARLIAMETDAPPALLELHRRLVVRFAKNVKDRNADRFRPHLTLCRFKSPASGVIIDHATNVPVFDVRHVTLMRSTLEPQGATHHEVASCTLE